MTRRRDLMCEDIFGCVHAAEVPISEDGEILAWQCRCGKYTRRVEQPSPSSGQGEKP